jgi:hypothetical protein
MPPKVPRRAQNTLPEGETGLVLSEQAFKGGVDRAPVSEPWGKTRGFR